MIFFRFRVVFELRFEQVRQVLFDRAKWSGVAFEMGQSRTVVALNIFESFLHGDAVGLRRVTTNDGGENGARALFDPDFEFANFQKVERIIAALRFERIFYELLDGGEHS